MAKNICPKCGEVVLGFGDEVIINCVKCGTVFKTVDSADLINTICPRCFRIFEAPETPEEASCPFCRYLYRLPRLVPQNKS